MPGEELGIEFLSQLRLGLGQVFGFSDVFTS
jgi:hypothetical protein